MLTSETLQWWAALNANNPMGDMPRFNSVQHPPLYNRFGDGPLGWRNGLNHQDYYSLGAFGPHYDIVKMRAAITRELTPDEIKIVLQSVIAPEINFKIPF